MKRLIVPAALLAALAASTPAMAAEQAGYEMPAPTVAPIVFLPEPMIAAAAFAVPLSGGAAAAPQTESAPAAPPAETTPVEAAATDAAAEKTTPAETTAAETPSTKAAPAETAPVAAQVHAAPLPQPRPAAAVDAEHAPVPKADTPRGAGTAAGRAAAFAPAQPAWAVVAMPEQPARRMVPTAWPMPAFAAPAADAQPPAEHGTAAAKPTNKPPSKPTHTPAEPPKGGADTVDTATAAPDTTAEDASSAATGESPVERVRKLQRLQDRIATGAADVGAQRKLLAEIDRAFEAAAPAVWQNPANARALIVYFLSGGTPAVLRAIVQRDPKPAIEPKVLLGTLHYVEGDEEGALRALGEVDARSLPNNIGGQIALAQAALVVRNDAAKAGRLLALARLLMPGTLVEEGALRRQILVAAQTNDAAEFERLAAHYFFRFRQSAYAGNFRQRFAAALTHMQFAIGPDGQERLAAILKPLDDTVQREIYLSMARTALLEGKTALAAATAEHALGLAAPVSLDAERAQLYVAAARAVTPDRAQEAATALAHIDRARLDPSDVLLASAALKAADSVRLADKPDNATAPQTAAKDAPAEDGKPPAVIARAQAALQNIDGVLTKAPR